MDALIRMLTRLRRFMPAVAKPDRDGWNGEISHCWSESRSIQNRSTRFSGNSSGDEGLKAVSERVRSGGSALGLIGRLSGDEFRDYPWEGSQAEWLSKR